MEVKEALQKRRSVRKFTEEKVPDEMIHELLHAAMSGPSACNKKPWEFYVISQEETLEKLKSVAPFSKMSAPLAIVVCGDRNRSLPQYLGEYWVQDCSAATENILLQAVELGLGAVWCGVYPQKYPVKKAQELLELNENVIPLNIIYLGFPESVPEAGDQYEETRVHYIC